jgi:NAD(P)H-dependent flavin oxidoreductase YrpB (nitropropane dioxygenase family)
MTPTVLVDDERVDMTSETGIPSPRTLPWLIQGGMGVAISGWPLARAVARAGQLGVVSGTALDTVFVRRLQDDGIDEALQEVLDRFPVQSIVRDVRQRYAATTRPTSAPYRVPLMLSHRGVLASQDLLVLAAYVEVARAKSGHDGLVGINLLTKVQLPTAATLFGAMLAGVDYVLMGAGVPTHIPGLLDRLSRREVVEEALAVVGTYTPAEPATLRFDPARYAGPEPLTRPKFLAIVSSHVLATALARRSNGVVDGFVVERPIAGGHNAPPRGAVELDADGSPRYGPRDEVDFAVLRALALPFWIGGGVTSPSDVHAALDLGATGVQVGTLFAYCRESGMEPHLRASIIAEAQRHTLEVTTSMVASSTGYPFKVATVAGTMSDPRLYAERERTCDLGYLREAYARADGGVGYRCSAEPVAAYLRKGGALEDTVGATCLCNALMATCGLGQVRSDGRRERPIVTSGDHLNEIRVVANGRAGYGAHDVINYLGAGHLARFDPSPALAH